MIKPEYLTYKPGGPSTSKRFLDQKIIPVLIDAAGGVEAAVEHWAIRVRRSPGVSLGVAIGIGALLSMLAPRAGFLLPRGARRDVRRKAARFR